MSAGAAIRWAEAHAVATELVDLLADYSPCRFAWGLADPHEYVSPIPARGMLGLWDWTR